MYPMSFTKMTHRSLGLNLRRMERENRLRCCHQNRRCGQDFRRPESRILATFSIHSYSIPRNRNAGVGIAAVSLFPPDVVHPCKRCGAAKLPKLYLGVFAHAIRTGRGMTLARMEGLRCGG